MCFSPDEKLLATLDVGGAVRLWNVPAGTLRSEPLSGKEPADKANELEFTPGGRFLAVRLLKGGIGLIDPQTGRLRSETLPATPRRGFSMALAKTARLDTSLFSADGRLLISSVGSGVARRLQLIEVPSGRKVGKALSSSAPGAAFLSGVFAPAGAWLATGGLNSLRLWRPEGGGWVSRELTITGVPSNIIFSPSGDRVAVQSMGGDSLGEVWLWDTRSGKSIGSTGNRPLVSGAMMAPLFSPDGRLLAVPAIDGTVRVLATADGRLVAPPLPHSGMGVALGFSPDGRLLLTQSADGTGRLWDTSAGQLLRPPLKLGEGTLSRQPGVDLELSPDGKWLAWVGPDEKLRLWWTPTAPKSTREAELRTWISLGARLNAQGAPEAIPWKEWQKLRDELKMLTDAKAGG